MKLVKSKDISLPAGVLGLAATEGVTRLYAACMDGAIYDCDPNSGTVTPLPKRHNSFASGCVLLPSGQTLISAGYDGRLLWHDLAAKKLIRSVQAHSFWSWRLVLSPDGSRVASTSGQYLAGGEKYEPAPAAEPTVKVYDGSSGELLRSFDHGPPVLSAAFAPDGKHVAAGNMMGEVCVWDVESGKVAGQFTTPDFTCWGQIKSPHYVGGVYGLEFTPGGDLLCCGMGPMADPMAGNGKMTWQSWDWRASPAKKLGQINDGDAGRGLMETLALAPGGGFLMGGRQAQGTWTAAVFADDGKLLASLDTKSRVTRAAFTPDGRTLYLAATVAQPKPAGGKWGDYGRIHVLDVT